LAGTEYGFILSSRKGKMEIRPLTKENLEDIVYPCICEESTIQFAPGKDAKKSWIKQRMNKGYAGQIAYEQGKPVGFVDYLPIEYTPDPIAGEDLFFLNCIYIIKAYQGRSFGKALLSAAEREAKRTKKGMAVAAFDNEYSFMPASYFIKAGYKEVDRRRKLVLLTKTFKPVSPPFFLEPGYKPQLIPGKVAVELFWSGRCPHNPVAINRVKKVCGEFPNNVIFKEFLTGDLEVARRYGISFGIFINGEGKFCGPPPSEEKIREVLQSAIDNL
jgi:GNAT superfamily N-acetyltransferase